MRNLLRTALASLFAFAAIAGAQTDHDWTVRPLGGVAVPTGAHRRAFGATAFLGAQSSVRLTPAVDLVASFAWQPSTGKYAAADNRADVLVYNVGLERVFRVQPRASTGSFAFAGGGVGGRAFDFRSSALTSTACYSAYASAGAGYELGRSNLRFELRDNLFCYKQPVVGLDQSTHNEISVSLGAGVRF